jgi:hypothetical protein
MEKRGSSAGSFRRASIKRTTSGSQKVRMLVVVAVVR